MKQWLLSKQGMAVMALASFREKYVPKGETMAVTAKNGDVYRFVMTTPTRWWITDLPAINYDAKRGENGGAKNCSGRGADDIYLSVPIGTTVVDTETGEVLADLTKKVKRQ